MAFYLEAIHGYWTPPSSVLKVLMDTSTHAPTYTQRRITSEVAPDFGSRSSLPARLTARTFLTLEATVGSGLNGRATSAPEGVGTTGASAGAAGPR